MPGRSPFSFAPTSHEVIAQAVMPVSGAESTLTLRLLVVDLVRLLNNVH